MEELIYKIEQLNVDSSNIQFVNNVKAILERINDFDLVTAETKILTKVLPIMQNQVVKILIVNDEFFGSPEDTTFHKLIKDSLEVVFQLTEIIQTILHYVYEQGPIQLTYIESILIYLPKHIELLANHWNNSPDMYKSLFSEELMKIFEATKHLFAGFVYLLESPINIDDAKEKSLLGLVLITLCKMPKYLYDIDSSSMLFCWKTFAILTTKYSGFLKNKKIVEIAVQLLTDYIWSIIMSFNEQNAPMFQQQKETAIFLLEVFCELFKRLFQRDLGNYTFELLIFYVRMLSIPSENYTKEGFVQIENEIIRNLDDFFRNFLIMYPNLFKSSIFRFSETLKSSDTFEKLAFGYLKLLIKLLEVIRHGNLDFSSYINTLLEDIFQTLPFCHKALLSDNKGIYGDLIINMSSAVLLYDSNFLDSLTLLKYVLQEDLFVAILAIEVYSLIAHNITPSDCYCIFVNLLYAVQQISSGIFTYRVEMVYLKMLLRRLLNCLSDDIKERVIKLFPPKGHIAIWKYLGFDNLPLNKTNSILRSLVENTADFVKSSKQFINFEIIINIAETIDLISGNDMIFCQPRIIDILIFINQFWCLQIDDKELLNNNLFKYFIMKITDFTAQVSQRLKDFSLDLEMLMNKLRFIINNENYWIPILKIVNSQFSQHLIFPLRSPHFKYTSELIHLLRQTSKFLFELCVEGLRNLIQIDNSRFTAILDGLNPILAMEVCSCIQLKSKISVENFNECKFTHKCLKWNNDNNIYPPCKKAKRIGNTEKSIISNNLTKPLPKTLSVVSDNDCEYSVITEILNRIKGEVKYLTKANETEKLTAKQASDVRIIMSKLSSLI